jgi:YVTN family beta-propeller protein
MRLLSVPVVACLILGGCRNESAVVVQAPQLQVESLFALNGNRSVTLVWTQVQNGAASAIAVHRGFNAQFSPSPASLIASLAPSATSYTDTGLVNGSHYYYRIVPLESGSDSPREGLPSAAAPASPLDYGGVGQILFSGHIQPIFLSSCAVSGCHVGGEGGPVPFAKTAHNEQFSLLTWDDLLKGGDHGAFIVPFRANKSHLVYHLNTDTTIAPVSDPHMPLTGFSIPDDQLSTLMRWIDEGAPNDVGAIAFSTFPDGEVLATNQAEDVVSIIDIRTGLVARYVQAGLPKVTPGLAPQSPHNITVDRVHGWYYVNLVAAGKVLKYRLSDNALVGEMSGILSPTQVALTTTGDTGFVSQFNSAAHAIRMFDTRTMQLFAQSFSHPQLNKPHGVQITPDGRQVYITGNLSDNVIVLDLASGSLDPIWLDPANPGVGTSLQPYQTVMTRDNKYAYVSCQLTNDVRVIDRDSLKMVKRIPVGTFPLILAITPDDRFIYVPNRNSNSVSVIRTSDNTVTATIPNVGPQPHGIAIDALGRYAYVTCENVSGTGPPPHHPTSGSKAPGFIAVIDIATNTVVKLIEVANFAAGIAVVD